MSDLILRGTRLRRSFARHFGAGLIAAAALVATGCDSIFAPAKSTGTRATNSVGDFAYDIDSIRVAKHAACEDSIPLTYGRMSFVCRRGWLHSPIHGARSGQAL